MKTRHDFVSNSSSCSFLVKDAKAAIELFKMEFGEDIVLPWKLYDTEFTLYGDEDALHAVKDICETSSSVQDTYEGHILTGLSFNDLLQVPSNLVSKVHKIDVSTEDSDAGNVMFVRLLRSLLERNSIAVEDNGDVDSAMDKDDFIVKLMCKAFGEKTAIREDEESKQ